MLILCHSAAKQFLLHVADGAHHLRYSHVINCSQIDSLMQVLPGLGDVPAEAVLNLVIHHLRRGEVTEAHALVKDLSPNTPQEYILKVKQSNLMLRS